jgi:5-methyltetrahydropteroyltriglutamate--homocysteine methyltransferase
MAYLITHEIGSLAKPEWRVKAGRGIPFTQKDIESAAEWGARLGLYHDPLLAILKKKNPTEEERAEVIRWSSRYGLGLIEHAGVDVVYDGEQQRSEMYQHAVNLSEGFVFRGLVRSFDNKYYKKAACVGRPEVKKPWHVDEFLLLKKLTNRKIKIPITGAYTIAAWSFDEYYAKQVGELGSAKALVSREKARRQFILDVARYLIRPNVKSLIDAGAQWIQIDEPAATTIPSEVPLFVESFNESVKGLKGEFSVHICYSNYNLLFPHIQQMDQCSQFDLELSNRDLKTKGIREGDRPGYEILRLFKKYKIQSRIPRIGLGVTDIHSDFIEPPELIRDRILYAVDVLGDPGLVNPSPDCGLRTRTWEVAYQKLVNQTAGTRLAESVLDGRK